MVTSHPKRQVPKIAGLGLFLIALLSIPSLRAQGDPYYGYTDTNSYFLPYSVSSFDPDATDAVQVAVSINGGVSHDFTVDTGSRGLYVSSDELGPDFQLAPDAYTGDVDLTSSHRVEIGMWTSATTSFNVTDQNGNPQTVNSTADILDVMTLGAEKGHTARYNVDTSSPNYTGFITLTSGSMIAVQRDPDTGEHYVEVTHNDSIDEQISYAQNPGVIKEGSNMGIGFDLGSKDGTGPVGDNMNQIYNPLLNLDAMNNGTMIAGYVIETKGIQLGLTGSDSGFAYTKLNSTPYTSTNSVPDWQTPMGQTTTHDGTNAPGIVVMDSGITDAFISAPGLHDGDVLDKVTVSLMNSGGAAGYMIDESGTDTVLNPTKVVVVPSGTDGAYSENMPPYQTQFFNTGRNVFKAFDVLYDAEDGYMGILPNAYGATDPNVFFTAQPGGFPDPIPEPGPVGLCFLGGAVVLIPTARRRASINRRTARRALPTQ